MPDRSPCVRPSDTLALPSCSDHPGSRVRRYRSHGPQGPGVYLQCIPGGSEQPHLLSWADAAASPPARNQRVSLALTRHEREVLNDAGEGLTVRESAKHRGKSSETVKTQRKRIMIKLGARNITQAVAIALADGHLASRKVASSRAPTQHARYVRCSLSKDGSEPNLRVHRPTPTTLAVRFWL
jgi:DNA-binding CsgD family transcriptional regulator